MEFAWTSVWCYDECHSICQHDAAKVGGTSCKCACHRACFCGDPTNSERVHRAHACEWWVTKDGGAA